MLNKEVISFHRGLQAVVNIAGVQFTNGVTRNNIRIQKYLKERDRKINEIVDVATLNDLRKEVEELRIPLLEKHSNKNEDGSPKLITNDRGQQIYDLKDVNAYNSEAQALFGAQTDKILAMEDERRIAEREWEEEEATIDIYMIPESYLPDVLTANQKLGIAWMVKELREELDDSYKLVKEEKVVPLQSNKLQKKKN